jgi:hypothetical protein
MQAVRRLVRPVRGPATEEALTRPKDEPQLGVVEHGCGPNVCGGEAGARLRSNHPLDTMLDEVIPWVEGSVAEGIL